jgi:putative FmdB family regulatory protein
MPIYEYRCDRGHTFEVLQRMSDDPLTACQACEAPVRRVFHPVAVHFKGSGFYNTDYGKSRRGGSAESSDGDSGSASGKGAEKKAEKTKAGAGDAKGSDGGGSGGSAAD